jgi:hypothetical protein
LFLRAGRGDLDDDPGLMLYARNGSGYIRAPLQGGI